MSMLTIYSVLCGALILVGAVLFAEGIPYITNSMHKRISAVNSYYFDKIPSWIYVRMETEDAFTANNPINVNVTTTIINLEKIRGLQLSFEGADKYFPNNKPEPYPSFPPFGSTEEEYNQYRKAVDEYWQNHEKSLNETFEQLTANILHLQSDKDMSDFELPENLPLPANYSIPKYSTFSGSLRDLTYSTGGTFDIGITINKADGGVIGYGMSDLSYVLKEVIEISPPETLLQIKNNNIMSGLAWIGISLPFLIAGLTGLLEIFKHYAFL